MDLLRLITCGHVDDGKSTLLGRLLHDTKSIFEDQWAAVQLASQRRGDQATNLAFLTDGLRAEREQGITIDVAYRYFATPRRKFILADCPGHFEFTRNMVTGASTADLALLLIDVRHGLTEQTCRHAFLTTLLGIKHLVVCINKMDLVNYQSEPFERVRAEFMAYAERLSGADIQFIPLAALHGDNVVSRSSRMPWYEGASLLYLLENVYVSNDVNHVDARLPVQKVLTLEAQPGGKGSLLAGQVASGVFRPGEEIVVTRTGTTARISALHTPGGEGECAFHPMSVLIELDRSLDVRRGDMLARPNNQPPSTTAPETLLCWLSDRELNLSREYLLKHTTAETPCTVSEIRYKLDIQTLHRQTSENTLIMNDFCRARLHCNAPIFGDNYLKNRCTGAILLIDPHTNETAAAGILL